MRTLATIIFAVCLSSSVFAQNAHELLPNVPPKIPTTETGEAQLKRLESELDATEADVAELKQHILQQENWISRLLGETQDQADGIRWRAEAKLLAPEFSVDELALLNRWELNTEPLRTEPKSVALVIDPSPSMAKPNEAASEGPWHVYTAEPASLVPLRIAPDLPKPLLSITDANQPYPTVHAATPKSVGSPGKTVTTYFEFDTRDSFDSPHFWRYPALIPVSTLKSNSSKPDLTSTRGLVSHVFTTTLTDYSPGSTVRFPFRISAMSYPLPDDGGSAADFVRMARLLQFGLSDADSIRETFNYVRHKYIWGTSAFEISALDAFRAGIAGCGDLNEMIGTMLELKGIRFRAVAGFNPTFRVWYPGGGHTGAEVFEGQRWNYIDTFLGIYTPGVSAADFSVNPIGQRAATGIFTEGDVNGVLGKRFGRQLTLRDLFKYRIYADRSMRLPVAYMFQLRAAHARAEPYPNEVTYGLNWPLRSSPIMFDPARDLPETQTIHVRARIIVSSCRMTGYLEPLCSDPQAVASEWARTSFTIRPRELIGSE